MYQLLERRCAYLEKQNKDHVVEKGLMKKCMEKQNPLERMKQVVESKLEKQTEKLRLLMKQLRNFGTENIELKKQLAMNQQVLQKFQQESEVDKQDYQLKIEFCVKTMEDGMRDHELVMEENERLKRELDVFKESNEYVRSLNGKGLVQLEEYKVKVKKVEEERDELLRRMRVMERSFNSAKEETKRNMEKYENTMNIVLEERDMLRDRILIAQEAEEDYKMQLSNWKVQITNSTEQDELKDNTISCLRQENTMLRNTIVEVQDEIERLKDVLEKRDASEKNAACTIENLKQELQVCAMERQCYQTQDAHLKSKMDALLSEIASSRQKIVDVQSDYILQIQTEHDCRISDKQSILLDIEHSRKPKQCMRCHQTYTEQQNSSLSCSYHPGHLQLREYPLLGKAWTCCHKIEGTSLPCTLGGAHESTIHESTFPESTSSTLNDTKSVPKKGHSLVERCQKCHLDCKVHETCRYHPGNIVAIQDSFSYSCCKSSPKAPPCYTSPSHTP